MLLLLATLWLWDAPACGVTPIAYRVESQRIYVIATLPGLDDEGNLIMQPIYNVWAPTFIKEGAETSAEVPCEPASGECCIAIVTAIDEAGNLDEGDDCGD